MYIVRETRDFEHALTIWESIPVNQKNWVTFKPHFHEAKRQLRTIRGPKTQQSGYHQASSLSQKISTDTMQQLNERNTQMMAMLQSIPGLVESNSESENSSQEPSEHVVANVTEQNDQIQLVILRMLKDLRSNFQQQSPRRTVTPPTIKIQKLNTNALKMEENCE